MKLQTSDKTGSFGKRPHIKKGYYPAKLLSIEPYTDKDGNLKEGTYGRQLIFEFALYTDDGNGKPTDKMMYTADDGTVKEVILSKFIYHEYKDKKNMGQYQTAITPNSAITRLLVALGWTFTSDGVDLDPFIGRWIEANIDDYDAKYGEEKYKASTIANINKYEGPSITEEKPKEVVNVETMEGIQKKMKDLLALRDSGALTEDGYLTAAKQLQAKLDSLN